MVPFMTNQTKPASCWYAIKHHLAACTLCDGHVHVELFHNMKETGKGVCLYASQTQDSSNRYVSRGHRVLEQTSKKLEFVGRILLYNNINTH